MAFATPTYATLFERIKGDLKASLTAQGKKADPFLRRTKLWVLAHVYAAVAFVIYGLIANLSRQILVSTATDGEYILVHASEYGLGLLGATKSSGTVRFSGANATVIAEGTEFVRDDGTAFITTAEGTIASGVATLAAEAVEAGVAGNIDDGTTLTLSSPLAGVDSEVEWMSGFDNGVDVETVESLQSRVVERKRVIPHGGAPLDYDLWARQVAGVYRSMTVPLARGALTVDVYFLHVAGDGPLGLPTSGQVEDVQEYIDAVRPVGADFLAKRPDDTAVAFTFGALTPNDTDTRNAINAELDALFRAKALTGETIDVSDLYDAIDNAVGVEGFDLDVPSAALEPDVGEVFVRGVMTWP